MADSTHEALRAHMAKWRKGKGFNASPLGELEEKVRYLCERLDALAPKLVVYGEAKLKRKWRTKEGK